jgi:hypothetical protein
MGKEIENGRNGKKVPSNEQGRELGYDEFKIPTDSKIAMPNLGRRDKKLLKKVMSMTPEEYQEFIRPESSKDVGYDEFVIPPDSKVVMPILGRIDKKLEKKVLFMTDVEYQEFIKGSEPVMSQFDNKSKRTPKKIDMTKEETAGIDAKELKKIGIKQERGPYSATPEQKGNTSKTSSKEQKQIL